MNQSAFHTLLAAILLASNASAQAAGSASRVDRLLITPAVDAHQHLMSPAIAAHQSEVPPPTVTLPPELRDFLQARINASRDRATLGTLYTERAWLLESFNPAFIQTRDSIVDWWVGSTDSPYDLVPVGYGVVFAEALAVGDPRVKNMIFDVTTVIDPKTSAARLKLVASRLRHLGMGRIVYGSDTPDPEHMKPHEGWAAFRDRLGLTNEELWTIAGNLPAYAR